MKKHAIKPPLKYVDELTRPANEAPNPKTELGEGRLCAEAIGNWLILEEHDRDFATRYVQLSFREFDQLAVFVAELRRQEIVGGDR